MKHWSRLPHLKLTKTLKVSGGCVIHTTRNWDCLNENFGQKFGFEFSVPAMVVFPFPMPFKYLSFPVRNLASFPVHAFPKLLVLQMPLLM